MRQIIYKFFMGMLIVVLTGCTDRIELEDATLIVTLGLDLDEHNNLIVFERSPIFSREVKKNTEHHDVQSSTVERSYTNLDSVVAGSTRTGKTQLLLISKRLLQRKEILPYLDALYRDPKNSTNLRIIAIDGPVSEVVNFELKNKPRLSIYLSKLIDSSSLRHITSKVTLRKFHYMMVEPGITPFISEVKKENEELRVLGITLLNDKGYYRTSLNLQETELLDLLRNNQKASYSFTIPVKMLGSNKKNISILVKPQKRNITTNYQHGLPQFDIEIKVVGNITERTFQMNLEKKGNKRKLEAMIENEINKLMAALIKKLQRHQVDPIGLGLYVRAYHYNKWKAMNQPWPEIFAKSSIRFQSQVEIKNIGVIK
ncbi:MULTISPECIES: Ger(x)C family spore germination protein [Brevibacillus]|uniref:Ger(x)C family spore germination protein n=1 Tax=Brevibacillus TaxID=55080 RepID=UPI000E2EED3F|nr:MULTISPECIES: Ger(x)C family spore germination protein [Brevibacillus]MED1788313.1 Ger(x)C family spore germination protein [Brevibacillus laterosporus]RFB33329.1 Ger(x)C family spore germination protein [Brevibacillus sp. VP]